MHTLSVGTGLVIPLSGWALAAEDEPLATIEVTAEPISEAEERAPTAFVTEVDVSERKAETETLTDVLAESVGVQVRRFGGLGAFSTISIRGSSPNQVQFYLDGVPLSRAVDETVNIADLPLQSLQRIEVYRGTIPVGFGGGGIGGVVNLVTEPPSATPVSELSVSYGSFDTRRVVASHTRRVAGTDVLGHVTYLGSEGNFTYRDDNGTPENPFDDERVTRKNNAFNSVSALFRASRDLGNGLYADFTEQFFFKDQGVPGPASTQFLLPSLQEWRALTYFRLTQTGLAEDTLDLSGTVFTVYGRQDFDDPQGDFGPRQDTRNQTLFLGGNTIGSTYALPRQTVGWFGEISYELFSPFDTFASPSAGPDQTRLRFTLALQDEIEPFGEWLLLIPTLRYEHLLDDFSGVDNANRPDTPPHTVNRDLWSPSLGAAVPVQPWLSIRGNFGQFQRAPSFSELFGNRGSVQGRADLKPEKGLNRDIGFVAAHGPLCWLDRVRLEYVYFNNDIDDIIVLEQVAPGKFRPRNISAARIRGHEVSFQAGAFNHAQLDINFTHQDAEDRSDIRFQRGKQLPLRPADELYLRLDLFRTWLRSYYELNFISGNFRDPANFQPVPSRHIHTIGFITEPLNGLQVSFEAVNLTDNQIRDLGDFPLPGRSFFGNVRAQF